ncbi:hypothetical protein SAMN05421736_104173 [Evansella caseinilytica]|uniref:Uncharacterized protein n=1 Tax=Evansella caseinilytica TaxID=1503961 RepID=A0A1H3NRI0_9BACI|nr:hypothetical protein [Evansella caseinilytica]SDY91398.1 hypothetical protein SAMN05421736_104173 [Evansella caseinilytica]
MIDLIEKYTPKMIAFFTVLVVIYGAFSIMLSQETTLGFKLLAIICYSALVVVLMYLYFKVLSRFIAWMKK